jgi:NADH:ubiquinone oxidoreductase subunit 6 (subunit J)
LAAKRVIYFIIFFLFLFVIMLLDPFSAEIWRDKRRYLAYLAVLLGACAITCLYPLLRTF